MQVTVRSANLQCRDITIDCPLEWRISELKSQLEAVHPAQPAVSDQKVIYAGRLLEDNQVLVDIAPKQQNETLIFHLVCKSTSQKVEETNTNKVSSTVAPVMSEGLRHRTTISSAAENSRTWNGLPNSDPLISQQMTWWQQAYAEHYRIQYAHYLSSMGYSWPSGPSPATPTQIEVNPAPPPEAPAEEGVAAAPAAGAGVIQAAENDEEANPARDWLDWMYLGTRLAVLLGVVFYYSSLSRLLLVVFIGLAVYLYQNEYRRLPQREVNNNHDANIDQQREAAGNHENEHVSPPVDRPVANNPSTLIVALNMLVGFFASIIPEVPAPEAL